MAELTVYEKRTCTTCKNLAALLDERGIDFDRVDYHVEPLTEAEIRELVARTGWPAPGLFRAREPVYSELGLGFRYRRLVTAAAAAATASAASGGQQGDDDEDRDERGHEQPGAWPWPSR
jgi:arsenate reductase-like glutaredoxin family protein